MKMRTKLCYTSPEVNVLELRSGGIICQSTNPTMLVLFSDFGSDNAAGASMIEDRGYDL